MSDDFFDVEDQAATQETVTAEAKESPDSETPETSAVEASAPNEEKQDKDDSEDSAEDTEQTETEKKEQEPTSFPILDDAYEDGKYQVTFAITYLPRKEGESEQMLAVGVRNHLDQPILKLVPESQFGPLPPLLLSMLEELKSLLPGRAMERIQAKAKEQAEKEKRQQRHKPKQKTASTLPTKAGNKTSLPAKEQLNLFDELMGTPSSQQGG